MRRNYVPDLAGFPFAEYPVLGGVVQRNFEMIASALGQEAQGASAPALNPTGSRSTPTIPVVPVTSVNGKVGAVVLGYADVGAAAVGHLHTGVYDPAGTAAGLVANYLPLAGGTLSGPLVISKTGGGAFDTLLQVKKSDGAMIEFGESGVSDGYLRIYRNTAAAMSLISNAAIPTEFIQGQNLNSDAAAGNRIASYLNWGAGIKSAAGIDFVKSAGYGKLILWTGDQTGLVNAPVATFTGGATLELPQSVMTWSGNPTHSGSHTWSGLQTWVGNVAFTGTAGFASNIMPDADAVRQIGSSTKAISYGFINTVAARADAGQIFLNWRKTPGSDAAYNFTIDYDGKHNWGTGAASLDTTLYRSAVNELTTDGVFKALGGMQIGDAVGDSLVVWPSAVTWSGNPTHSGNHTFSAPLNLTMATGSNTPFVTTNTGTGAWTLNKEASAAAASNLGRINYFAWNSSSALVQYARTAAGVAVNTAGSQCGSYHIGVLRGGTFRETIQAIAAASATTITLGFDSADLVKVPNLAGTGNRNVGADSTGLLIATDWTLEGGWDDPTLVAISYDYSTRKATFSGTGKLYWRGVVVIDLAAGNYVSTAHTATNGKWFLSYNGSAYSWSQTPWTFDLAQMVFVNYVSAAASTSFGIRECHGRMNWETHEELHSTMGCYKVSGFALSGYALSSTTAADRRPAIAEGVLKDEDLKTTLAALAAGTYTQGYVGASSAFTFVTSAAEICPLSGTQPRWNNAATGALTALTNNQYVNYWLVGIPVTSDSGSQTYRFVWVAGQATSTTRSIIDSETPAGVLMGDFSSLATEFVFLARVLVQASTNNWVITSVNDLSGARFQQIGVPSGLLTSVSADLTTITGTGTVADPLVAVMGEKYYEVAGSFTGTGSAADFVSVDGETYPWIELELYCSTHPSASNTSLWCNADTTTTNYYAEEINATGTTASAAGAEQSLCTMSAGTNNSPIKMMLNFYGKYISGSTPAGNRFGNAQVAFVAATTGNMYLRNRAVRWEGTAALTKFQLNAPSGTIWQYRLRARKG